MLGKMRNFEADLVRMKEAMDEEFEAKQDVEKQLVKAQNELHSWRTRYETEGMTRIEDLEREKGKVNCLSDIFKQKT